MLHVLGDGLAGLMLARALPEAVVHGDGASNTPPLALVHLYAGRSFRRHPLEVDAFKAAIDYWRSCSLAREFQVVRHFRQGDRLQRSAAEAPCQFAPSQEGPQFCYGPAFTIETQRLEQKLREECRVLAGRVDDPRFYPLNVWAVGTALKEMLPGPWDHSSGRLLRAQGRLESIVIGQGVHLAPRGNEMVIGGRSRPAVQGGHGDELECAARLLGKAPRYLSEWRGQRLACALDRWPLVGWWEPQVFVFGAFASRALFWLPYCVQLAVKALADGHNQAIPAALSVERIRAR